MIAVSPQKQVITAGEGTAQSPKIQPSKVCVGSGWGHQHGNERRLSKQLTSAENIQDDRVADPRKPIAESPIGKARQLLLNPSALAVVIDKSRAVCYRGSRSSRRGKGTLCSLWQ